MNTNKSIYSIVRNETNEVIFVTDNFAFIKLYVSKHFPNYIVNEKYKMIVINSKYFTFNKIDMNYDVYSGEYYE